MGAGLARVADPGHAVLHIPIGAARWRPRPARPSRISPRERISHRNEPCGCPEFDRAISRRSFLKRAGVAGLVAGLASETAFTRLAFGASNYSGDVLVILSLRGGFDGLQAVVPAAGSSYDEYIALRPNVGIPSGQLLQLDSTFGLHPALASLKPLYDAGTFGDRARRRDGGARPVALLRHGGARARRAGDLRPHRLDRPRPRAPRGELRLPGRPDGERPAGHGLPRPVTRAGHVVHRRLRALGRVGRRTSGSGGMRRSAACTRTRRPSCVRRPRRRSTRCRRRRRWNRPATHRRTAPSTRTRTSATTCATWLG